MIYAGTGKPISFMYYDSGCGGNAMTDTLTVRIFPAPSSTERSDYRYSAWFALRPLSVTSCR
jgi:hypothetical protein